MQSTLPEAIQWLQALGPTLVTFAIGMFGGYIAWRQWRTAQDKIQLDLFDKRFSVYLDTFRDHKWLPEHNDWAKTRVDILVRAQLLFGKETRTELQKLFLAQDSLRAQSGDATSQRTIDIVSGTTKRCMDMMVHQMHLPRRGGRPSPKLMQ